MGVVEAQDARHGSVGLVDLAVRHERRNPVAADRPEATDFIDIRINFHNTARFFGALHKRSHWVITVERHITREQIERLETRPEVLSLREGVGPGGLFTLIVSSNAGKQFVIDRLTRKLTRIATLIGRHELAQRHRLNSLHIRSTTRRGRYRQG